MIPSLVVSEIRQALVEYLATTFALSDDEVRDALSAFLTDNADGIFRGPYLRVRTPFKQVSANWDSPLEWLPEWFLPYAHQATAFERLSSVGGSQPEPTLVTTGTGSGKTECFLFPLLDHCARMRQADKPGVKALILYPMNALASDQAGRIAELIAGEPALAGVRAGLYVGSEGRYNDMGPNNLIDKREVLRDDPPDILLTNYKMLDFLLLRREDQKLWRKNDRDTLQYVVLDEFHTYDGAQGTDVAMLLRRLGATLGMDRPSRPLGTATPVATSATLGSGATAIDELREFAGKVFGVEFDRSSTIGETRQSVEEACDTVDWGLPIPDIFDVVDLVDANDVAAAFCIDPENHEAIVDNLDLGRRLLKHPLTRAVLSSVGDKSRSWQDAIAEIVPRAPNWGRAYMSSPDQVELALAQFLRLLSEARRMEGDRERPLFSVEVQLWIREVTRMLRTVDPTPSFRWRDSALAVDEDVAPPYPGSELPAIYCRRCGMSGWMALASEGSDALVVSPSRISRAAIDRSPLIRSMLRAHPDDQAATRYSPSTRRFDLDQLDAVPVLVTPDNDDARANRCPACSERNGIRFLGLAVASLASVSINTLFGSEHLEAKERKLLAFTDSVQDASHRASFFGGRTHRINLRSLMARVIKEHGTLPLSEIGTLVLGEAETARDKFGLIPPDLTLHPLVKTAWTDKPGVGAIDLLESRLGFEADLEFGLRARVGRTLELSRVAVAHVQTEAFDDVVSLLAEDAERMSGSKPDLHLLSIYLRGVLERMRLRGGILHPLLDRFVVEGGRQWFIWGGRPDGLPPFTPDQGRPSFFTTSSKGDLDSLSALGQVPTWVVDWGVRSLGLDASGARDLNQRALALLASQSDAVDKRAAGANSVFGLHRSAIKVTDIADVGGLESASVRCLLCGHVHAVTPERVAEWIDTPCLRYRCTGRFEVVAPREQNYYRSLYRSGQTRRVVTGEHTGLLQRAAREDLEKAFKDGTAPNAPNVITATPTLEMGIDIGDLSAVMLTSVPRNPASYIQRVGRAGRLTGNSLVTTFVRTDSHGLYYLADPEAMLAGDVRPPNCFLDAAETMQRQYVAYLLDRLAAGDIKGPEVPRQIGALMQTGVDETGVLGTIISASMLDTGHVESFLALFGDQIADSTVEHLTDFAAAGIEGSLKVAVNQWNDQKRELGLRRDRLKAAIERLETEDSDSADAPRQMASLRGQRTAIIKLLREHRNEYTLSALERLGVLPNYTLVDDSVTLRAMLWAPTDGGGYETNEFEFKRSGRFAVQELAPGNSFYAGGHRHVIDAVEIGAADAPLYEVWRLCKECGFGMIEAEGEPPETCQRCTDRGIADTGARHTMLRLKTSFSSGSEENARVFDDSDDRRRERYSMVELVDVEPESVYGAWELEDRAFGAELARTTHIRTINLGFAERSGEGQLPIAGHQHHVTRFTVCRHCGAVVEARDDRDGTQPERLHHGWCKVRSGAEAEEWDPLLLFHELTTESVRMVLPVSMFEVAERLSSFKGALLLGLRQDFGGDPDHLQVALADSPNRQGDGRRRFLVLFDSIPGGTGYLGRIAEPDRLKRILEIGREIIARCPCSTEGRSACHRCLLGVVDKHEYDLARRDIALEILDDLLDGWTPNTGIDSVAGIDIGKVEESELERRFKVALHNWAGGAGESVSFQKVPGDGRYDAFELRLEHEGVRTRYRIEEQQGISSITTSLPDFLIRRMDERGPEIAVFLDGYQFHASPEINNIADDARKRRDIRESGRLVWNLVWEDVKAFDDAARADPPKQPPLQPLLRGTAKKAASQVKLNAGGALEMSVVDQNPMALLLDVLARPDLDEWNRVARSAVAGLFADGDGQHLLADEMVGATLEQAMSGTAVAWPDDVEAADAAVAASTHETAHGHRVSAFLDMRDGRANDERWTVVSTLADSAAAVTDDGHKRKWRSWMHWSNVLQYLRGEGRDVVISASSEAALLDVGDLSIVTTSGSSVGAKVDSDGPTPISEDMEIELSLIEDDAVRELVQTALAAGSGDFVSGHEIGGHPIEAAWPSVKIAVLAVDDDTEPSDGWDIRPAAEWTAEELQRTIQERTA